MKTRDLTDLFSLVGKTALITGGGSGLGLAVAATVEALGDIHIVFSNAGIGDRAPAYAGALFVIEPGAAGLPIAPFSG